VKLASAHHVLTQLAARMWKPPEPLTVSEWAEKYRILAGEAAAEPGPFRLSRTPYLREPMDAFTDPSVSEITLMFASQTGKTSAIENMIFHGFDQRIESSLFIFPTEDDCQQFNTKRLRPTIEKTPRIRAMLRRMQDITTKGVTLKGCYLAYGWAKARRTLKSRSIGKVFCDEIDEYEDQGALDLVRQRVKTFANAKVVKTSTPTRENVGIHAEYMASDRRTYHVPCPHCGKYQQLRWNQVRWEGGANADPDEVLYNTWYECEECRERIGEEEKPEMLLRGIWVPHGCGLRREADGTHTIIDEDGKPYSALRTHRGYHLSGLYSLFPKSTWGHIAAVFVTHKGKPPPEFFTEHLGEPYSHKGRRLEVDDVAALRVPTAEGGYLSRTIPPGVLVLIAGVDIQLDRFYYVIRGFTARGERSYLIDNGMRSALDGNRLSELGELIDTWHVRTQRADPAHGQGNAARMITDLWTPVVWMVDSGARTKQVYDLTRRYAIGRPKVQPVKGRDGAQTDQPWAFSKLDQMSDGTRLPDALMLLHVQGHFWKEHVHGLIRGHPALGEPVDEEGQREGQHEGQHDGKEGGKAEVKRQALFNLPADVSDDYLRQVVAEEFKPKIGANKRVQYVWALRPGFVDNHYFDCEQYIAAGAEAFGVRNHLVIARGTVRKPPVLENPDGARGAHGGGGGGGGAAPVPARKLGSMLRGR